METVIQHTSTTLFPKATPFAVSHEAEATPTHGGKKISYFLWVYVGIFSSIMVAVMVAERYFIPS